jgi:spermidine synthase
VLHEPASADALMNSVNTPNAQQRGLYLPDPADRLMRLSLAAVIFTWGIQAIVTQSLIVREAMVLMAGSELAWGIVLFAWLLGVAIGGAVGAHLPRPADQARCRLSLIIVLLALNCAACAELWLFRGARGFVHIGPGELLPLSKTVAAAIAFVTPASFLVGCAFPLACAIATDASSPCLSFGAVYALESAGSLVGGAVFSFWAVETLSPIQTALLAAALSSTACAAWCWCARSRSSNGRSHGRETSLSVAILVLAVGAASSTLFAGQQLNAALVQRRWKLTAPGYELVAEAESRYQNLALGHRGDQYSLYCDGQLSADFPDPYTFGPLAHFYLCQHPAPQHVLLLGGGAEGLLAQILLHPVKQIDYVETDPRQISLLQTFLPDADRQALADPRVRVHHLDARYYVKTQADRFDLVIARLPEPTSALRARFFTDQFFAELHHACRRQAVLCLTAAAAPGELTPRSREYLASLQATVKRHFPHTIITWGDPAHLLAATSPGLLTTSPDQLAARYVQRGVDSPLFDPAWFFGATDWLEPTKLNRRAAELASAERVELSTDLRPIIYVQRLILWEAATGKSDLLLQLRNVPLPAVVGILAAAAALTLLLWRANGRSGLSSWQSGAVSLAVATTGFATMALSLVWLFAFQNLYGYVYARIGWIVALFMGGLVVGCLLAARLQRPWHSLIATDLLLSALAAGAPVTISALSAAPWSPTLLRLVEVCTSVLVFATGLLGGATFPLAASLLVRAARTSADNPAAQTTKNRAPYPSRAAGRIVAADHAGACLGAILSGVLLVPVFGTPATAAILSGLKLASATLLFAAGPPSASAGHRPAQKTA